MFDITKGIGIIFVIAFHVSSVWIGRVSLPAVLSYIFRFLDNLTTCGMMATFFMISGYGFRPRPLKKAAAHQAKLLLIPYLWVSGAVVAVTGLVSLLQGFGLMASIKRAGRYMIGMMLGLRETGTYFGVEIPGVGPAWFLLSLFISWCVLSFLFSKCRPAVTGALAVLCGLIGVVLEAIVPGLFCIPSGLRYVAILYFGYLLKKRKWLEALRGKAGWLLCAIMVGVAAAAAFMTKTPLYQLKPDSLIANLLAVPVVLISAVLFGMTLLLLTQKLNSVRNRAMDAIAFIGQNSLLYFCANAVDCQALPWYLFVERFMDWSLPGILIHFAVSMTCATVTCLLIRNRYSLMEHWKRPPSGA